MLNILFIDDFPEDADAEKFSKREMLEDGDAAFFLATQGVDLNKDTFFLRIVDFVDKCDLLAPNVLYKREFGTTHAFERVSGGVKVLWLMYHYSDRYIFPSSFLGENCYQPALWVGEEKDAFIYDDSSMLFSKSGEYCMQNCHGKFYDVYKKYVVDLDKPNFDCIDYFDRR